MSEKASSEKILMAALFDFVRTEAAFREKLVKLVDEYCAEFAEAINDVAKEISNRIESSSHHDKQVVLLSVIIAALTNTMSFYLGNYEQPYRSLIVEAVCDTIKPTVEDAAGFIRKNDAPQA